MNDKIAALLNQQINKEFYSAYLYLDMSNYYDELDLDGYANYYNVQAQEERDHALLFMRYMQMRRKGHTQRIRKGSPSVPWKRC